MPACQEIQKTFFAIIKETLQEYELDIDCVEIDDADVSVLTSYDYVLIGTYTWGDGDLPYEAEDF